MTDDRDRVMRIIMARCPDLGPDDLAALAEPDADALPVDQVLDVLDAMLSRMDQFAERLDTLAKAAA